MSQKEVSVIIPLYNKAPFVERAIRSLFSQTWGDFEWIVVDDGSTDDGAAIVKKLLDGRGRYVRQDNAGPGAARNTGVRLATGRYLAFLDADDEWAPTFLSRSVGILDCCPTMACVSSGYVEYPSGKTTDELWWRRGLRHGPFRLTPSTPPRLGIHAIAFMSPWSTMARAERVREYGGFFERGGCRYGEDGFLWLKLLLNHPVFFNLEPLARYHREASSLAGNASRPRPIEPILDHADEVRAVCPVELRETLERMLAWRVARTACMLGYWGQWHEGRALLRRFGSLEHASWQGRLTASVCASPVGASAGAAWRFVRPAVAVGQ